MKRRPCLCPKPVLWELNSFLMQTLSFVPINLHRRWPREWKHRISIKVLGFGHWNTEYNAMLCLDDHQTMAFKDQSTIPKATFIEISVYFFSLLYSPFKLLDTSIKRHVTENCSGAIMFQCACKGKFPWEGLFVKWVSNFTRAQLNRNQDFPERPLAVPLNKGNSSSGDEIVVLRNRE